MLPRLIVLTDRAGAAEWSRTLTETVREAVAGGARGLVLREKDLPRIERRRLLDAVREVLEPVGGRVGVASDVELATESGVDWVHLAQTDRLPDADSPLTLGRSCHDPVEVTRAVSEGCDYLTISPIALTASKPGYGPALGAAGLREACRSAGAVPVWALGGVTPDDVPAWLAAGAHGVAVMGAIMRAADPAAMTAAFLASLETAA
jgi:thiamine-phosphate diphosphorylase